MKKIYSLLMVFVAIFGFNVNVQAIDTSQKIYDYANLLTDQEEANLKVKVDEYISKYKMDMVLVTVNKHDKYSTVDYADDFYDYNGFGIGNTKDGVIFVIDSNFGSENLQMETTGEAIIMYDDERINNILDVVYEDYNYYELFSDFIDECSYYASIGTPASNKDYYINEKGDMVRKRYFPYLMSILVSVGVATIVLLVLIHKNKMVKKETKANVYLNKETTNITNRSDQFITTHTVSHFINNGGGYGGSSGGSSTHHSSSGISHGGGGRSR